MRALKLRAWDGSQMVSIFFDRHNDFLTNDMPIMQYTGLKDKNGVEIYEGDIVSVGDWPSGLVEFENESLTLGWQIRLKLRLDSFYTYHRLNKSDDCEVIGNICENPELLNAS